MPEIPKSFIKFLRKGYIRMIIFGSSESGKTYYLLNMLLPKIKDQYDTIIVMTLERNNNRYRKKFKQIGIKNYVLINKDFKNKLIGVQKLQEKNKSGKFDKEGDPIFNTNVLMIWDDVLKKKLFEDEQFIEQFTNMRHLQISTILITQIVNKVISSELKSNCNAFTIFPIDSRVQRREIIGILGDTIDDDDCSMEIIKMKAKKLYRDKIKNINYGFICMSSRGEIFI